MSFTNPKPSGYSRKDSPSAAEMISLAQQSNSVANGVLWNELTLLSNWRPKFEVESTPFSAYGSIKDAVYDGSGKKWYIVGDDGASPGNAIGAVVPVWSASGSDLTVLTINNASTHQPKVIATDGAGTVVSAGGNDSSSVEKFRRVASSGTTLTVGSIPSASTAVATGIAWDSVNSKFISCFDDGNVYTDADGSGTWTQITDQFNLIARTSIAISDTGRAVIAAADRVLVSDDAANWTEHTLPATADGPVVWVGSTIRRFFILGSTAGMKSADGVSWLTDDVTPLGFAPRGLSVNNRCIAALDETTMGVVASIDGARTWKTYYRLSDDVPNIQAAFKQGPFGSIAVGTEAGNSEDDELWLSFHGGY